MLNKMKSLFLFLATVTQVKAFWRLSCSNIQIGRIDPIVSPGSIASHVHTIGGPININTTSSYDSLRASFCTSCQVQDDKSAYWTPQLYYRYANGTYVIVRNDGVLVYYLGRGDDRFNTIPFPEGLKMLSGDSSVRSYDNTTMTYGTSGHPSRPVADRVSFNCLTNSSLPETASMVRTNCPNGLRAQIQFQSCWDGVNLYKTDQSHVAYMSQIDNGVCPPTHPKLLPHLFYEVLYHTNDLTSADGGSGQFMFANGDTTGFGFHGDFLNGWKTSVLQAGINQCLNSLESGVVEECAPLNASIDPYFSRNCPLQPPLVKEQINRVSSLPGCNQPSSGPARAPVTSCPTVPSLNQVINTDGWVRKQPTNSTAIAGALYQGCYAETNGRAFSGPANSSDTMTTEDCAAFCLGKRYKSFGTEYGRECYCGSTISTGQTSNNDCGIACSGNLTEYCGGENRLSVWMFPGQSPSGNISTTLADGSPYLGCYSDSQSPRSLDGKSFRDANNMTAEACARFAKDNNLQYFGLEYSSECYAGNTIGSSTISETSCNMNCVGASNETCGGPNALSVYKNNNYKKVSNPSPITLKDAQYTYSGCYTEGTSGRRAIPTWSYTDSNMTVESCVAACHNKNYDYAALEYMHECYCNKEGITNGGVAAPESDCNMLCDGNKTEYCGGSSRLSLYHLSRNLRL